VKAPLARGDGMSRGMCSRAVLLTYSFLLACLLGQGVSAATCNTPIHTVDGLDDGDFFDPLAWEIEGSANHRAPNAYDAACVVAQGTDIVCVCVYVCVCASVLIVRKCVC
jgi:hypothetical protein